MDSKNSIVDRYRDAQRRVQEVVTRKSAHEEHMRNVELQLSQPRRLGSADALAERAEAFFSNPDKHQPIATLQQEFTQLNNELPLFNVEIERRQQAVQRLQGEYNDFCWAKLKARDDENKLRTAKALIELAKCFADEVALTDEIHQVDANPPAAYRPMRVSVIGILDDPNSFVSMWLRELAEYYPHVKVIK